MPDSSNVVFTKFCVNSVFACGLININAEFFLSSKLLLPSLVDGKLSLSLLLFASHIVSSSSVVVVVVLVVCDVDDEVVVVVEVVVAAEEEEVDDVAEEVVASAEDDADDVDAAPTSTISSKVSSKDLFLDIILFCANIGALAGQEMCY